MGNGTKVTKDKGGTLIGRVIHNDSSEDSIEIKSVVVSSQAKFNLLSLTALMRVEWNLHGNAKQLILTKDGKVYSYSQNTERYVVCYQNQENFIYRSSKPWNWWSKKEIQESEEDISQD